MVTPTEVDTGVCPKALHWLIGNRAKALAHVYDDIGKRKGTKKVARETLAELLAYIHELELRDQLPYTQPPA